MDATPEIVRPEPPALPPAAPLAPPRRSSPLLAFFLDALIAAAILLAVSFAFGTAWGVWRGVELAARGGAFDAAAIGQPGPLATLAMALLGMLSASLVTYLWRRRATPGERAASARAARRPGTWGVVLLALPVLLGLSIGIEAWVTRLDPNAMPANLEILRAVAERYPVLLWAFAVLLAPMYEELLFRRVLFGRLWAAGRPWLGALLSGALFALAHEIPGQSTSLPAAAALLWLNYALMGVILAWVYRRTGTLWAPIALHAGNNLVALLVLGAG
ncbi:CPBP family intramembrane glutamic endopeptidase [Luteimonas aquatica]|uniref:CPBP family intramembrane glutamic endopeptidase n=1 Tax=Luteimonas aquatica TaxID=450364 RepID=UPI001F58E9D0|nr:CPBP family intramembrane glutamic endopeptidase [Luteimonas aquatica]